MVTDVSKVKENKWIGRNNYREHDCYNVKVGTGENSKWKIIYIYIYIYIYIFIEREREGERERSILVN